MCVFTYTAVGIGWAVGGLDDLDGLEPYLRSNYFVHLWLKNRRKGMKKQDGKIQLFDKCEGCVNGCMMTNQKKKGATCQKTLTSETLGVGDKGI